MAKQRFTPKQVADTLNETRGMVFLAAKKLGCSDDTIYNYAKRYKAVGDALRQQRGQFVDMAELSCGMPSTRGKRGPSNSRSGRWARNAATWSGAR